MRELNDTHYSLIYSLDATCIFIIGLAINPFHKTCSQWQIRLLQATKTLTSEQMRCKDLSSFFLITRIWHSLVLSSTSALSTKLATKQQFWENMTCRQRFCFVNIIMYYFEKERILLRKKNIDKISLQKGSTVCEKHAVKRVQRHTSRSARQCLPSQSRWSIA